MRVREVIGTYEPYCWEPSSEEIASKLGLRQDQIVRFDTNSSPYTPVEWLAKLSSTLPNVKANDYPDTSYSALRRVLSKYVGKDMDCITVTNGADEALDIVSKTCIDLGTPVLVSAPTYSMYRIVAEIMGGKAVSVTRDDSFSDDVDAILKASASMECVIFLCSPNNPTGNASSRQGIVRLLDESNCLVVVDESYYEFCGKTSVDLTSKYDNLIVVRTFSKGFCLAGARVGYIVASEGTISSLNRVRPPNSLSVISLALAEIALNNLDVMKRYVERIVEERERVVKYLNEIDGITVYPTEANFVLVRFKKASAQDVLEKLLKRGIVVRDVSGLPKLDNCLRFSFRTPQEDDLLLEALRHMLQ